MDAAHATEFTDDTTTPQNITHNGVTYILCERGEATCGCDGCPEPAAIRLEFIGGTEDDECLLCYFHYEESRDRCEPSIEEMRRES